MTNFNDLILDRLLDILKVEFEKLQLNELLIEDNSNYYHVDKGECGVIDYKIKDSDIKFGSFINYGGNDYNFEITEGGNHYLWNLLYSKLIMNTVK